MPHPSTDFKYKVFYHITTLQGPGCVLV